MNVQASVRPATLLHVEAFCFLTVACIAYGHLYPHHWAFFACLFLAPDLSLFLFLAGSRGWPTLVYNVVHSYVLPLALGGVAFLKPDMRIGMISLIWICHISFDRMLGYGLKYPHHFKSTHLQSATKPFHDPAWTSTQKDAM